MVRSQKSGFRNQGFRTLSLVSLSLFGFWILASGFFASQIVAQSSDQSLRLITSPLPISLATPPGTSVKADLRVQNAGNQTEKLKVGLLKFSAYGDTGAPKIEDRAPGDDYFDWVTFSEPTFTLAPQQWKTIVMTVNVPKEAAFGYYYAVTFSRATEELAESQPQAALVGATATLVLLEAQVPDAKRSVEVVDFSATEPWYEFLPATFTIKLKNTGNVHVAPRGNLFIKQDINNELVGTIEVNPIKGNILPGSTRTFTVQWDDGFPLYKQKTADGSVVMDSQGKPEQKLSWDLSQADTIRIGHFQADLALAYDDGTKDVPVESSTDFWVIPWRGLLLLSLNLLIVIGFFAIIITWLVRRRKRI